jgi:hypothetical protein
MIFMPGCAAGRPARFCPTPAAEYFTPIEKPSPRSQTVGEILKNYTRLSNSWDDLYTDRMKARKELEEILKQCRN